MDAATLDLIRRSHELLGAGGVAPQVGGEDAQRRDEQIVRSAGLHSSGGGHRQYLADMHDRAAVLRAALANDSKLRAAISELLAQHAADRQASQRVLAAAAADHGPAGDTPMGAREAAARKAAYLRAQRAALLRARAGSRRAALLVRALRYRRARRYRPGMAADRALLARAGSGRGAAAVRAAATQLGVPYVWGGNTPGKGLDCSSLVQHAWGQAGVELPRTTWDQIHVGTAVARSALVPGDLVFPHGGHVQMYAGGGKVIEAPYVGATVRISDLPSSIMAIRRPA